MSKSFIFILFIFSLVFSSHPAFAWQKSKSKQKVTTTKSSKTSLKKTTKNDTSKKAEGIIIGNIINLWNSFGKCESIKIR